MNKSMTLAFLLLSACGAPQISSESVPQQGQATPAASTAASAAAPKNEVTTLAPAAAPMPSMPAAPTEQVINLDAYMAAPQTRAMLDAAATTPACSTVYVSGTAALSSVTAAFAKAVRAGLTVAVVSSIYRPIYDRGYVHADNDISPTTAGGVTAIASLIGSGISSLPTLLTALKDIGSCVKSKVYRAQTADVPFDADAQGCVTVLYKGESLTTCK